jgi:hypothetical protein
MTVETLVPETLVVRPKYEEPSVRVMSEEEILRSFQVTQAMAGWWMGTTSPCTC